MSLLDRRRAAHALDPATRTSRSRSRPKAASFTATALALTATLYAGTALADARTEARRHFKAGMELVKQKKFDEGIKELEEAYAILPHPSVAFNIAQAQAEGGNLDLAIRAYRTYLKSDPPDREEVSKIVAQLEEKLAAQRAAAEKPPEPVKPGEVKPGEPGEKPGEVKPGEVKPGEVKPGEVKPGPGPDKGPSQAEKDRAETARIIGAARTEDIYEETVVTASRNAQSPLDSPNSTTIITRQDIQLSGITRIPELLRRVAGMDVMQITGGDTNVSMRGFNSRLGNKLLVLVNGRSAYNDILGSTFWESLTIDVDQIERIEVVRGPGSALYGANAFAGVVNIITIAPGEGRSGARIGYGDHTQAYGSAWLTGRDGDFAYRASAGYTRYPRWTREITPDRIDVKPADFDPNLGADNLRFDLRTTRRLGNDMELGIGGGYSRIGLNVYGIGPFNDYRMKGDTMDVTTDFRSRHFNARAYYTRLDVSAGSGYSYLGHTLYESNPRQNLFYAEANYVGDFSLPKAVHHDIQAGVSYRLKDIFWEYLRDDTPTEHHAAVYLQDSLKFSSKVNLVLSGRLDYVPYLGTVVPSPRGSLIIKPTDRQAVRVSGSTAFRQTTFLESYLDLPIQLPFVPGIQILSQSDRKDQPGFNIKPEQITTVEASYLNQQSDYFEFELTAYYNHVTNLIVLADTRNATLSNKASGTGGYDPATGRYTLAFGGWANQCDIYHVVGGEVGTRVYPVEGLDLFANYALNYSSQEKPSGCNVPEDGRTSRHKLNAGVQVRTKFGLNGELSFHYQSAQIWNEQAATPHGIVYEQFDLPAYTLVNGRLGFRFYKDKMEASVTVFNALAGLTGDEPQMHPFGNRVGRRVMGFFTYLL